jgi:pyruvate/2-oxoglutarate dehydrogenase complex dihydrolipoamide acyltransferase (E2) component
MLALWSYFWEDGDWSGEPDAPAASSTDPGAGSGKGKRAYRRAGDDFWLVRERYLRRFVPPSTREPVAPSTPAATPDPQPALPDEQPDGRLMLLLQARQAAIQRARQAADAAELRAATARISRLTLDIEAARQQNYARAIALLLLDIF